MYWKMSIDLARPLVPSMGQHDPLDGFVTCYELQEAAKIFRPSVQNVLEREIADMAGICREIHLFTDDPLGIGGLLFDASRIARLTLHGGKPYAGLLEALLGSAITGLESLTGSGSLDLPARHRLAFREFGVSIGLAGVVKMQEIIGNNPDLQGRTGILQQRVNHLLDYVPFRDKIQQFGWKRTTERQALGPNTGDQHGNARHQPCARRISVRSTARFAVRHMDLKEPHGHLACNDKPFKETFTRGQFLPAWRKEQNYRHDRGTYAEQHQNPVSNGVFCTIYTSSFPP
jgi:hypothetical protein